MTVRRGIYPALGALVAAAVLPLFFQAGGSVLNNLVLAAAYVGMALGLNVIAGFAGLLDLGFVAFYAIGAYTAGYLGSGFWDIHFNTLALLAAAAAATALAGVLIGLPTLRLRGGYIAIVTLAFGEIVGTVVRNGDAVQVFGGTLTAGARPITPIDKIDLPLAAPFGAIDLRPWYWFALGLIALLLLVNVRLRDSRLGRAWTAVREDEVVASTLGIPLVRTKLLAYATGAAIGGVSGTFLASYLNTVDPHQFQYSFSIFVFAMVAVGGFGSVWGAVAGAVVLSVFNNYVLPDVLGDVPIKLGLDFDLAQVSSGIYGLLLVVVVLLRPEGLVPRRR